MSRSGTSSSNKRIDCAQSFVLLKNEDKTLPMAKGKKTAILGPHVHSTRDLMSDYKGDEQCNGGGSDFSCVPTIAQAFTQVILPPAPAVSNEGPRSRVLVALPAVSWPWVPACGSLEPPRRGGENAQKTGKNGGKMGEIRPKKCEPRELTKDQLAERHPEQQQVRRGGRRGGRRPRPRLLRHLPAHGPHLRLPPPQRELLRPSDLGRREPHCTHPTSRFVP